jgi:hypothetical protein
MEKFIITTIIFFSVSIVSLAQVSELKILPGDGAEGDEFGCSVAISEDYTVVGASHDDDPQFNSGAAYIFKKYGANWIEEQKLIPSDGGEHYWIGFSASISGDYTIVSAPTPGYAYIFRREGAN